MIRGAAVVASLSAWLAVAAGAQASGTGSLSGVVTRGPTTPVCIAGQPCTKPVPGAVLVFSRGGVTVARAVTRSDGSYHLRLAPGLYAVRCSSGRLEPASVRLRTATARRVDFSIDSGIR